MITAADLCIEDLARENVDLREANKQLTALVADLAFENGMLQFLYERERLERLHGDATIRRLHHVLYRQRAA
jgi:hypothetical protein